MPSDLHISGIFSKPGAFTVWTDSSAPESGQHDPVLDFVHFASHKLEKIVQSLEIFVPCPQQCLLIVVQVLVGPMDGEVEPDAVFDQRLEPLAGCFPPPGCDGSFVDRKALVGDHQVGIQTQYGAKSFAGSTGSVRVVETEKINRWQFKNDPVKFETVGKYFSFFIRNQYHTVPMPFKKRSLHTVSDPEL